jgi:Leucine-rich repeat (LRR) protein
MMKVQTVSFLLLSSTFAAVWNELPSSCFYRQWNELFCANTTFIRPLPLVRSITNGLIGHFQLQIRSSQLNVPLSDLFVHLAWHVQTLILIDNRLDTVNISRSLHFRSLQVLLHHQSTWAHLQSSFFPQLIDLDLSYSQLTVHQTLNFDDEHFPELKRLNLSNNQLDTLKQLTGNRLIHLEWLSVANNPLDSFITDVEPFSSLLFLDLSSTSIKRLFHWPLLPRLQHFLCRECSQWRLSND